jgi:hypothetical protein
MSVVTPMSFEGRVPNYYLFSCPSVTAPAVLTSNRNILRLIMLAFMQADAARIRTKTKLWGGIDTTKIACDEAWLQYLNPQGPMSP